MIVTTNRLHDPTRTVLHVAGEVDTHAADELRRHLDRLPVESDGVVLVDLSAVTFMSCSALSALAEARARLGPRLVVDGRSTVVRRLLDLTGLTPFFAERAEDGARPAPDGPPGTADGVPLGTRGTTAHAWTFSRTDVDRVRGLLMAVHGCDAEQAWRMLALAAARHGVAVGEIAQLLIRAHREAPSPAAAAAALTVLMRTPVEPLVTS
jgi:two-component system, response regulator / RNA-binding antiterminator